jgi:hypothetical protein
MDTQEVLDKYFRDERTKYFDQPDALRSINGDTYLTYKKDGGIQLWYGTNDAEVCLMITRDGEELENMIQMMLYGRIYKNK